MFKLRPQRHGGRQASVRKGNAEGLEGTSSAGPGPARVDEATQGTRGCSGAHHRAEGWPGAGFDPWQRTSILFYGQWEAHKEGHHLTCVLKRKFFSVEKSTVIVTAISVRDDATRTATRIHGMGRGQGQDILGGWMWDRGREKVKKEGL